MTTMTVSDHKNLEVFQHALEDIGSYFLLPVVLNNDGTTQFLTKRSILKRKIHVREAWQIGSQDLDCLAVRPTDDVIIPDGEESPPIHSLWERRREIEPR